MTYSTVNYVITPWLVLDLRRYPPPPPPDFGLEDLIHSLCLE